MGYILASKWDKYIALDEEPQDQEQVENLAVDQEISQENLEPTKQPRDWSKYLAKEGEKATPEEKGFFGNLAQKTIETVPKLARHFIRSTVRAGEAIAGMPGDLIQMAEAIDNWLPKEPGWLLNRRNKKSFIQEWASKEFSKNKPATTEELKDFSSWVTNGYTDPQDALERFGDDAIQLAAVLSIGNKDPLKAKNIIKQVSKSFFAKGASRTAEALGAGPTGQAVTELGTLGLVSLIGRKPVQKFLSEKYEEALKAIPEGTLVDPVGLQHSVKELNSELNKGLPKSSPTKSAVINVIEEIQDKLKGGGHIEFSEIVQMYHDVNEVKTSKGLWDTLTKSGQKKMKAYLDKVTRQIGNFIEDKGKAIPGFYDNWRAANAAFATVEQSKKVAENLGLNAKSLPRNLAGTLAAKVIFGVPNVIPAMVGGAGLIKSGETMYRVMKNDLLRKHYLNVVKATANNNKTALFREMALFDRELKKQGFTEEDFKTKEKQNPPPLP